MKLYLIRHKPSGHYIPRPNGINGRGGSFAEPDPDPSNARFFRTHRAARIALTTWLRGKHEVSRGQHYDGEYFEDIEIVPVASRRAEDMEIVEKEIDL